MKSKYILFPTMLFALFTNSLIAQPGKVTGNIKGLGNRPVIFGYKQKGKYQLDTVFAKQDHFSYLAKPSDDGRIHLRITSPRYTAFYYDEVPVTVSGSIETPYKLIFKGGPDNTVLSRYEESIEWVYDEKFKTASGSERAKLEQQRNKDILDFILKNPSSIHSAYLLYWQTITDDTPIDQYENILKSLSAAVQDSDQGKQVAKRLELLKKQPVVGKEALNFTLPDTAGRAVDLNNYRGKYVLLDFWGHWCGPCIKSFPKLKQLQSQYINKLVIIGIAAEYESDKPQWLKTIRTHKLDWVQVSELKADKGEVNEGYNINAFPTYLLLDKNGIVLERSLSLEPIQQKLSSIK
ncbi:TlpA disulfide reductase family protein [Siphonobacter sp. SORGH_AS_1065]|uniref:TlpA disulfide reductase family protein n=1 Tax=Siphonobacter sp. SORGH_AS_1065 TaxID=3041795 RepID=UPI00278263D3|nr:TlpA disulfide reductase family protein [Siphonobacter sp. SORGH_AS_1065]MDQ1089142.1 thiol-disulfide isomerase/thioredoxin [Siphonobacter sp. SORGH_AS_1065]